MPVSIHCPKCGSAKTMAVPESSALLCYDCKHEFTPEKPFVPQRTFLSYGHDEHATLAVRLYDDLKARGHTVWFDEDRLQPGHDWETFIEKGLEHLAADKANAAVILLLTPHSVRRPDGYCLNEVARALSRGLRIIPLMVVESEPPLSICRIQWLDMRQCIPIHAKEAFYRPRFERLLKALEENQLDFEGTQQRLLKALQPLEFDADILRHLPKFTGRQWVFDAIDQWLTENPPKQRVFWISGGPGVGKTAIAAVLSSHYLEVAALHLCKFGHAQKSDPRSVVTSVVYQLTTQLPEYEARLASMDVEKLALNDACTMFDNLLVQPLAKLTPPNRSIVILIDALDEATRYGRNELASFIAVEFPKTPSWLRLIITSRPEAEVTAPLQGMNPFILDTDIESNRADIRDYLRRELASPLQNRLDAEYLVERIVAKSEALFLYIERVCDDIKRGNLSLEHLDRFPQGLGGVYWQFFTRQFPDLDCFRKSIRPALRAILAAREPLPVEILQCLFHWQDEELRDFTRTLGSLFPVTRENGCEVIKPYHKSLADWLGDEAKAGPYFLSVVEGNRQLLDFCLRDYQDNRSHWLSYTVSHLLFYLGDALQWSYLHQVLQDNAFVDAMRGDRDLDSFLDSVARMAVSAMRADSCAIFLKEESGRTLTQRAGCGSQELRMVIRAYMLPEADQVRECVNQRTCHPPDCTSKSPRNDGPRSSDHRRVGLTAWITATGKSFNARDYSEISAHCHHRGEFDQVNFREKNDCGAFLGVPLRAGETITGVLKVENTTACDHCDPRCFSEDTQQHFEILAGDIAMAIEHLRSRVSPAAQSRAIHDAQETIQSISREGLSLREVVNTTVTATAMLLRARRSHLVLKDRDRLIEPLWAAHGCARRGPDLREYRLVKADDIKDNPTCSEDILGLTEWIAAKQRKFTARSSLELTLHRHWRGRFDIFDFGPAERCESFMGVPLLTEGNLIGVLKVDTKMKPIGQGQEAFAYFTEHDELVFELIAKSAATAILNVLRCEGRPLEDLVLASVKPDSSLKMHCGGNS